MPIALIKTEFVVSPATVLNTPIEKKKGDHAEIYSFEPHMIGAGQRNRKKRGMLTSAAMQPAIAARI